MVAPANDLLDGEKNYDKYAWNVVYVKLNKSECMLRILHAITSLIHSIVIVAKREAIASTERRVFQAQLAQTETIAIK
jgi:hypothetical protein